MGILFDDSMGKIGNAIVDFLDCSLIGVVPEDDEIARQNYFGGVLNKRSQAMQSIDMIADNMIMGSNKIFDCTKKCIWNLFGRFFIF